MNNIDEVITEVLGSTHINEPKYYIIRTENAGVFFGEISERRGSEADLKNCRCIWYWEGAATLLQLAKEGTKRPEKCKFTVTVDALTVLGVIEIIPCTPEAVESITGVKEWKM